MSTECASELEMLSFLQNKSIIFAHTNMFVDPSHFDIDPVKSWIDNSLMIPLSAMRHQLHTVSVTPVLFSKEEEMIQTGINEITEYYYTVENVRSTGPYERNSPTTPFATVRV